jgi:hypothetical protein
VSEEEARIFNKMRDTIKRIESMSGPVSESEAGENHGTLRPAALRMIEWAAAMAAIAYGIPIS